MNRMDMDDPKMTPLPRSLHYCVCLSVIQVATLIMQNISVVAI